MHGPINVKCPNNISKWQMGFNSAFKGLTDTNMVTLRSTDYKLPDDGLVKTETCRSICYIF